MILRILAVSLAAAALSGCVRLDMPQPASESWTLARLSGDEAGTPPVYVPERVLERSTLASMAAAERALLLRGAQVRDAAASVPDPQEPAEDYAARQRALGTPPE
ncbi:hypothetical protein L2D01_08610 [Hyphomonadaceae bacterium ML37]|nr:hypothetical protein L2D01_08610 [Hyphomonadaceae bacterium ML37]